MIIKQLIGAKRVIMSLIQEKLSPKLSYKLMKFIDKIEVEEKFYNTKCEELIEKYGERDEKNKLIYLETGVKIKKDKSIEFQAELDEVDKVEVEKPDTVFTLDELDELKLSVADMYFLQDFIVE
ncbi:MAG: hypothetical protein ACI4TK_05230 [Agathobacter sp.]